MRAIRKSKLSAGLWLEDVPIPNCGDRDVLIKIEKTGICGTDLHIYHWDKWASQTIPVPLIIGHEFYGRIHTIGRDVQHLKIGDRVSGEAHINCGYCRNCRAGKRHLCPNSKGLGVHLPGAYAEFLCLPAENVYLLPDDIPDNVGAILDPLGNAIHTALSFNYIGEDVLITGAGPIGIMTAAITSYTGARNIVITDRNPCRLQLAKQLGATFTIDITQQTLKLPLPHLGIEFGFDVGFEMSGHPDALQLLVESMYPGSHIAALGIPPEQTSLNWHSVIFKELTIKGIYGREMFETWYKMIALLKSGLNIEPVITDCFKADDFEQAFQLASSGQSGKILLDWC